MSQSIRVLTGLVLALVMQGCQSGGSRGLSAGDKAAQQSLTSTWQKAVNATDYEGVAATYAPDAILLPPNSPIVQGRENIKAFFMGLPPIQNMKLELKEIGGSGDVAYVRGVYSMTILPPGASPIHDVGKYLEIRKRQPNGTWLMTLDMYSSDLPADH